MSGLAVESLFRVDGIVALVTGGGTGIGLMIAKALALNGAKKVYITGRRAEVLENAAKQSPHGNIVPLQGDVTSKESLVALAEHVRKEDGYLNLLVANAGSSGPGSGSLPHGLKEEKKKTVKEFQEEAMKTPMEDWDNCLRINVTSVFYNVMAFLDLLDEGNKRALYYGGDVKSQVIVTSSVAAYMKARGSGFAYRASKAGVTHMVQTLVTVFGEYGLNIRLNTIAPGLFPSGMAAAFMNYVEEAKKTGRADSSFIPEGRFGREEDMAGTILYLASRAGSYANGAASLIDGGRLSQTSASW
ncbi:NAD(P)-binding protein [Rhizodiscina lignyota]|uniref:NAD(P)-binding protein n=1 Tax=Rhizodiscina lignyota TaxID=1504668 RepID=A0A9P4IRF3_9PEZI|nr:NAD(P)-binding protein [Rhizodiscina lignyota]